MKHTYFYILSFLICLLFSFSHTYTPGERILGTNGYIEYQSGDLPIIISVPHGGSLKPTSIPTRDSNYSSDPRFEVVTDSRTIDLAKAINLEIFTLFKGYPHIIISNLHRSKLDANRKREWAYSDSGINYTSNPLAEKAYNEFHGFIDTAKNFVNAKWGKGLYIDLHGHAHSTARVELGYLISSTTLRSSTLSTKASISSINPLYKSNTIPFIDLLRGANSFGGLLQIEGFPSVPSPAIPAPKSGEDYFDGGYNTTFHCVPTGNISGFQMEVPSYLRMDVDNRNAFAKSVTKSLQFYILTYYKLKYPIPSPLETYEVKATLDTTILIKVFDLNGVRKEDINLVPGIYIIDSD